MLIRSAVIAVAALMLGGCQTAKEVAKEDDYTCRSYGLEFGTPEYAYCRDRRQSDRTARYQADQQRRAIENAARSYQTSNEQRERERKKQQRCSFTPPDANGWSKRVCVDI